jgi:ATP-binding protein involved in chromosome partitioning
MEDKKADNVLEEQKRIEHTISQIEHRIAVFSGKGGVGKSTVAVNLAYMLQKEEKSVGILDADITGPNVLKMLDIREEAVVLDEKIIPFEKYGAKVISVASMIKAGQPVIWRGPMRSKMIQQFLADVEWGKLDYLIADLPPGTGDEILTVTQRMKPDYAVIVTTPQEVSVIDAERALNMAKKMEVPFIGVVENMAGFVCPHCSKVINIFGEGGGKKLAADCGVPFLGSIPLNLHARIYGDHGMPIVLKDEDSEILEVFKSIASNIEFHYQESLADLAE